MISGDAGRHRGIMGAMEDVAEIAERLYGLLPEAYARHQALVDNIWKPGLIDPVVLELCRLRVAQIVRSPRDLVSRTPAAAAAGLDEDKISRLAQWPNWRDVSPVSEVGDEGDEEGGLRP